MQKPKRKLSKGRNSDITSLHDLRNSTQHGDTIPSDWDINRYEITVKAFFDGLCRQVFNRKISYASMSVAEMLRSPHKTELMLIAEKYIENGNYGIALQLLHTVILYHYMLIKTNLFLPMLPRYEFYSNPIFTSGKATEIERHILDLYTSLDTSVDRLAIGSIT